MPKIFIVMGKSASGKDTIFKHLRENKEINLQSVVGYTTRPIRQGETNGTEYFFVTNEELDELKRQNKVIEHRVYDTIHGKWNYFTVDDGQFNVEKYNYLLIGTLETYEQICGYFGPDKVVPIYIEVEDGVRLTRALKREKKQVKPKYKEMCRRFLADEEDFSEDNLRRLDINTRYQNKNINTCLDKIIKDIKVIISSS